MKFLSQISQKLSYHSLQMRVFSYAYITSDHVTKMAEMAQFDPP